MSLYNHFPDKDAILVALAQEGFAKIGKALPKPGSGAPLDVLRKAMLQYIDFGLKHADEYQMVFMTRRGNGTANSKAPAEENIPDDAGGMKAFQRMLEYIDDAVAAKEVCGNRFELGMVFWAGIHGCVSLQLTQHRFPFWSDEAVR